MSSVVILPSSQALRLARLGAVFAIVISLTGAGLGAYMTLLKFRMTYTPCLSELGGCSFGGMSCHPALASSWSTLLQLPLSMWGTAFYLTTLALALRIVRRPGLSDATTLLVCGFLTVLVSLVLGGYVLIRLDAGCPLCMGLYFVSVLLLVGGAIARSGAAAQPRRDDVPDRPTIHPLDVAFGLGFIFVTALGLQSMAYHGARNFVDDELGCSTADALPPASIRLGSTEPKAILTVFLDLTCNHCLEEYGELAKALDAGMFPAPVQIWIYHTPRQVCDSTAFPGGYSRSDDAARDDNACLAAIAAHCAEQLKPGIGRDYLGRLFALQKDRRPGVPVFTTGRIAERAVKAGLEIDPVDPHNSLFECINEDSSVVALITEHQRFAEKLDYKVPALVAYAVTDGVPDLTRKKTIDTQGRLSSVFANIRRLIEPARTP